MFTGQVLSFLIEKSKLLDGKLFFVLDENILTSVSPHGLAGSELQCSWPISVKLSLRIKILQMIHQGNTGQELLDSSN